MCTDPVRPLVPLRYYDRRGLPVEDQFLVKVVDDITGVLAVFPSRGKTTSSGFNPSFTVVKWGKNGRKLPWKRVGGPDWVTDGTEVTPVDPSVRVG